MPSNEKVGTTCRACGAKIEFITGPSGKTIPAQRVRSVYFLKSKGRDDAIVTHLERAEGFSDERLYISHFETCPDASRFSRKR